MHVPPAFPLKELRFSLCGSVACDQQVYQPWLRNRCFETCIATAVCAASLRPHIPSPTSSNGNSSLKICVGLMLPIRISLEFGPGLSASPILNWENGWVRNVCLQLFPWSSLVQFKRTARMRNWNFWNLVIPWFVLWCFLSNVRPGWKGLERFKAISHLRSMTWGSRLVPFLPLLAFSSSPGCFSLVRRFSWNFIGSLLPIENFIHPMISPRTSIMMLTMFTQECSKW